jgi:hypothetical protein
MRQMTRKLTLAFAIVAACLSYRADGQTASTVKQYKPVDGVLTFDLGPHGMEPSTATVSAGWYLVRVRNGISTKAITVVVAPESSASKSAEAGQDQTAVQATIEAKQSGTEQLIHLQQGSYTVTATGAASRKATIEVTADEKKGE